MMRSTARLRIDLDAVAHNYRVAVRRSGAAEVAPVLKASAYGLGEAPIARRLYQEGARRFYVAQTDEAIRLRDILPEPEVRIYVLDGGGFDIGAETLSQHNLSPVIATEQQLSEWIAAKSFQDLPPIALQFDTGMNRLGLDVRHAQDIAAKLKASGVLLDHILSHLASADTPADPVNVRQIEAFSTLKTAFPGALMSLSNSAGLLLPLAGYAISRPGITLFGGGARGVQDQDLRPVAIFEAQVLQIRRVSAHQAVGYNGRWVSKKPARLATLGAGYADGVLRAAEPLPRYAAFAGIRLPYAGAVSMDLMTIDATDAPNLQVGDWVELFGQTVGIDEAASACRTIAYELLTRIGERVRRTYVSADESP